MIDDATLLRRYAAERADEAFAELVRRHLPLVYSAALRRLGGDTHGAEDIAQIVFCTLAREAPRLSQHHSLTGWLYTVTRNAVIDSIRTEKRRRVREEEAHIMQENSSELERTADWSRVRPVLDTAMDALNGAEREAVLLRFFQGRPFSEIGSALELSEDAARKRVERALEKLRSLLRRRGVVSTSAALATLLAGETISAAPASLVASVTGAALATGGGMTTGIAAFFAMTKLQMGIAAAVIASGTVGLINQRHTMSVLRDDVAVAHQQVATLANENAALLRARREADAELANLRKEISARKTNGHDADEPAPSLRTLAQRVADNQAAEKPAEDAARREAKEKMHRRYDPFLLQQRGLSPIQADRFVELKMQQAEARQDFQAAVEQAGLRGDDPGVMALRAKLSAPNLKATRELLGDEGYAAYNDYEHTSAYRLSYVEPMMPMFASANMPLSAPQAEQLVRIVMANDHPYRAKPTDIGSQYNIDWDGVILQAKTILAPAQMPVIEAYASRMKSSKR